MAAVISTLVGGIVARNAINDAQILTAGDTIPAGYWVSGAFVQGGDPTDVTPPWQQTPGVSVAWPDITGKPAVIAAGADATAARAAIGAGTSNLALGTTASTALAGNGKAASATTADAATKLATARTIALTGAVTGTASFDGSANATIATTDGA